MTWRDLAACAGETGVEWFPTGYEPTGNLKRAREVCDGCPVRAECLAHALESHEQFGIWAGTTQRERTRMARARRRHPVALCGTEAGYNRHRRVTMTDPCQACKDAHTLDARLRAVTR